MKWFVDTNEDVGNSLSGFNPSRPNPGRREKKQVKFLFSHCFVVPQKVL